MRDTDDSRVAGGRHDGRLPPGVAALAPTGGRGEGLRRLGLGRRGDGDRRVGGLQRRRLLGGLLGRNELGDLAVHRGEQLALLAEPDRDRLPLLGPLGDEPLDLRVLGREREAAAKDGAPEPLDLVCHLRVERRDPVRGVDPVQDVGEGLRAEDQLERRGRARRIEVEEARGDRAAARDEVPLRDQELPAVEGDRLPHLRKLQIGEVDELVRAAEADVELIDLGEDLARLGLLGGERRSGWSGVGGGDEPGCRGREETGSDRQQQVWHQPSSRLRSREPAPRGWPGRHEARDVSNLYGRGQPGAVFVPAETAARSGCLARKIGLDCGTFLPLLWPVKRGRGLCGLWWVVTACFCLLVTPASGAGPSATLASVQAADAQLAANARAAVLDLYSLDARLGSAEIRLNALRSDAATLRGERAVLRHELQFARLDIRLSQAQLASRLRFIYAQGSTSSLDILMGAKSLGDAMTDLDDLNRVAASNAEVLLEVRTSQTTPDPRRRDARAARARAGSDDPRRLADRLAAHRRQGRARGLPGRARAAALARLGEDRGSSRRRRRRPSPAPRRSRRRRRQRFLL